MLDRILNTLVWMLAVTLVFEIGRRAYGAPFEPGMLLVPLISGIAVFVTTEPKTSKTNGG